MRTVQKFMATTVILCVTYSVATAGPILLTENFEDGMLDPRMSVQTTGSFSSAPGIKSFTGLEGQYAFGFGRSTNRYNSFDNYVTKLVITFDQPTPVTTISFITMEVFDNWGSGGSVWADGELYIWDFGRQPYNDRQVDTTFRSFTVDIDRFVTQLTLRVSDITDLSEIYVDNIVVSGGSDVAAVPIPAAAPLGISGLLALFGLRRSMGLRVRTRRQ